MSRGARTVDPNRSETVELRIDARAENLALARLALAGSATRAGAPESVVADLKLAVTEACTNAIKHAYDGAVETGEILVRFAVERGSLSIEVEDSGMGFEPGVRSLRGNGNGSTRGLGLLIIDEVSDELTITSGRSGSRIAFVRRFDPVD